MSDVFRTQVENNSDEDRKLNKFLIAMSWLAAAATVKKEGGLLCIIPWHRTFIIYLYVQVVPEFTYRVGTTCQKFVANCRVLNYFSECIILSLKLAKLILST